ncbi:hypothetical protein COU01_01325 [Candidatus Falkowbacteria bacterium CG10_big_fil_rev_8_21_14_0_10_44_15]|uniref:Uncharacterized protein n=1 Tax=Candidatus Falkowbacteria bacterium CG10_big_fil_rev_8_21_14_0_10_44_15 TaxID=1974569 RepID=A0A2H0V084_9BACT|nr:MAG: hypothetical protein COU01_01325 [Candidatus Falkowbacteria bacterium CG10_big_fil_rev_8_21_14_0_10_44_15]
MSKLRKVFTVSVMLMTILSMSVVVAPQAQATASAGDLIKMSGLSSVYYLAADGKRYVFPNENSYFSWYSDFSSVVTVSQSELESYPLGKNITMRPGTKLVKITTDPKVYAVETNGSLVWVPSETVANTLYGANWARRIVDVPDAFFTNYTIATGQQVSATAYPTGSLVKFSGSTDVYYIASDGKAQKVESAAMSANRFKTADVITAPASVTMPAAGTPIASAVATLIDTSSGAGGTAAVATGSGVSVALASDNPAAATVVTDTADGAQSMIPAFRLNFTAAADGDVVVRTVKITRGGISADTDVVNMYLLDGSTVVASSPSISTKVFTFTNSAGIFTVTRGTTKAIDVKFDLKGNATAGITINFAVASASDITTSGAAVSGSFPITGNTFTSASVTDLGKLTLTNVSPTAAGSVDPQDNYEIWRFTAAGSSQDVELRKMIFTIVGSVNVGDLKNFGLWDGGTQIGGTVADMSSSKTITLDLSSAPYTIVKGVTKTLSLKANIVSGTTRTFRASIQNGSDLSIYDKGYGVLLRHNGADSFTVLQPVDSNSAAVSYTINSGSLTMSIAQDSPTGNIASSTTNTTLLKVSIKASGEDVKITSLTVNCDSSVDTKTIKNLKVLWDGSQVGSAIATSGACDGAVNNDYTLGSTVIARAGQTHVLTVAADITGTTTSGETLVANLEVGSSNAQGLTSLTTLSTTAITGRTLTIAAGTLTVVKNVSFGDGNSSTPTGVAYGANTKVASFTIIGGAGEPAEVTQISLADVTAGTKYVSKYFQNVKLMHGTTQLGNTLGSPSSGADTAQTHTFNISPAVTINSGEQYVVDVYADVKSTTLTTAAAIIKVSSVTASGKNTGTAASYSTAVTLQSQYIATAGGMTIAIDSDTPLATNLLMGATDQTLGKFKFTASSSESITITELVISVNIEKDSGATGTVNNIRLFDVNNVQIGSAVAGFDGTYATTTYAHAIFKSLSLVIPKGTTKVIIVKADLNPYEGSGLTTTGQAIQLAIVPTDYDATTSGSQLPITGTGSQSGQSMTATTLTFTSNAGSIPYSDQTSATSTQLAANVNVVRANEMVLYRAKLMLAWNANTPSGLTGNNSSKQTIAVVNVANTANSGTYPATVKAMNISVSTTISNAAATNRNLTVYKDSASGTVLGTTTYVSTTMAVAGDSYTNTNFLDGDITDVEISDGSTKTFFFTLDTTDAATQKTLSVTIPAYHSGKYGATATNGSYGLIWSDGSTTNIIAIDNIDIGYKTLTY